MNNILLIPEVFVNTQQLYYVLLKPDGYYAAANPYFIDRFQLTEDSLTQLNSFETICPSDHAPCKQAIRESIENPGMCITIQLRIPFGEKAYTNTSWEFTCIDAADEAYYIQCIGYDMVEVAEEKATINIFMNKEINQQEMLEQMLSNSVDVYLLTDINNSILYCSPNIEQVLGYKPDELIGRNGFEFVHPEDIERTVEIFKMELEQPGKNNSIDVRFRKKGGAWKWLEAKGKNLFHNPHINAMLLNLNDISLRKQAEQVLEQSQQRYKSFFNNLQLPLFIVTSDYSRIVGVNENAVERYGYSEEEFRQKSFSQLFVHETGCEEIFRICNEKAVSEHVTKSGEKMLVQISCHEIAYSAANEFLIQVTDVTESYRIQKETELGFEISDILIRPTAIRENLKLAINKLRKYTGWEICELWLPSFDGSMVKNEVTDADTSIDEEALAAYLSSTESMEFPAGDYVNVNEIQAIRPFWIEDIYSSAFQFKRINEMKRCGLQSVLLIPVIGEGKVVCCLGLFSVHKKTYNRHELNLVNTIANLFGAEIAKQHNSLMLNHFFLISRDILTIAGLDGRYKRVNPAFEAFSGYSAEEAKAIHPLSYVHDYDKVAVLEKLTELSRGVTIPYFENRVVTKNGDTKWIGWTATPLINEGIVIASHRDITPQKEMLEALQISNERYEFIKRATNEAVWEYDLRTNKVHRSKGYELLFGYTTDSEHSSIAFWESKLHPADKEQAVSQLHSFLGETENNLWQCEYRFLRSNGSYAYVSDKGFKIYDSNGMLVKLVGSMQDISEHKEFAEILKVSNERYELVAKATREAIWDLDLASQKLTWSEGYKILFGHGFEDAEVGKDFWESNIHTEDRQRVIQSFSSFLDENKEAHWECDYRFRRQDGSYAYVADKCYMIYNLQGAPLRVVGAMQDVTRQKLLEKEIIETERNRQFQVAQAAVFAQEKERAEIGKELHDNIGQLLTTTKLYLEMMKNKQENPEVLIDRSSAHINSIINEVRSLSRSLVPHSLQDLGLIASVNDLLDNFRVLGTLEIKFIAPEALETIADSNLKLTLYRIIQEKLNNIVRHSDATKIKIEFTVSNEKVFLFAEDNGKGFDLQNVKRGQGITNIISRAELHNGTADFISNPGNGTKLFIQIPIKK
ncbi:MAG: PAS domain S-box protein [Lacibacter sp.]